MASAAPLQSSGSQKPPMTFWQIWNMSFGFFGIQFGFELQNSNVSRIFETLGANADEIPILWIAAPLTGLLVQPIIGYLSDRTWHPFWGRRRPFFLIGAVLATLALFVMPNSPELWIAGGMLWMMDASINISMEPFRAFVGDMLPDRQRTTGFATQSFLIGVGSVIAALLPWIFTNWFNVSNTAEAGEIPPSVKYAFYAGGLAFLLSVVYTVVTTKEYPPEDMEAHNKEREEISFLNGVVASFTGIFKMPPTMQKLSAVQFFTWFGLFAMWIYTNNAVTSTIYDMKVERSLFNKISIMANALQPADEKGQKEKASLSGDIEAINKFQADVASPVLTINLANRFANDPALSSDERTALARVKQQFNDGGDWLGVCSSVRNGIAALFAFLLPVLAGKIGRRKTHMLCLLIGGIGLISIQFIPDPKLLIIPMAMVGIAWASILCMPYAMLAGALPSNKMGYYMGVFNAFIVFPQILAATVLGFLTYNVFNGHTMATLTLGGILMIFAALLTLRVDAKAE